METGPSQRQHLYYGMLFQITYVVRFHWILISLLLKLFSINKLLWIQSSEET
jgi:hypothetical protein